MPTVFVYGTLLRGMQRSTVLSHARFMGFGKISGRLTDLGHYPGLVDGDGCVTGELYEVDLSTIELLDQIEGYEPTNEEHSLFHRRPRPVTSLDDGSQHDTFVYLYNGASLNERTIPTGDYRAHVAERTWGDTAYIAYGSNLNPDRLKSRVGDVYVMAKGYLQDFRLAFNKANWNGSACANLQSAQGHQVPFVAYRLPYGAEQLELLDSYEGAPSIYRRIAFPFSSGRGHAMTLGHLYVANAPSLGTNLTPTADYLEHILIGYRLHGFQGERDQLISDWSNS